MNPQFDHKFLEHYLSGKMSPVEKESFEARLASDHVLKAELEAMKRMRNSNKTETKEKVNIPSKRVVQNSAKGTNYWPYLLIAFLSFVALLYLTLWRD